MTTTYTLTDDTYDGYYTPATGTFTDTSTPASTNVWAVLHFGGLTWDHTLLTEASLSLYFTQFNDGVYAMDVIVEGDGVPTGTLLAAARRIQVGTLTVTGSGVGAAYLTFDLKVASTGSTGGGTFDWLPTGAYTAIGTANSDAFGTVNGAWTKHERDPADSTLFRARSVTFIVRGLSGGITQFGDVGSNPSKFLYATTSSNTGLVGIQYIRDWERGRASGIIECPKTGWDIAADEAVRDGHTGMMVAPEAWDPPEPKPRPLRPPSLNPRRRG